MSSAYSVDMGSGCSDTQAEDTHPKNHRYNRAVLRVHKGRFVAYQQQKDVS